MRTEDQIGSKAVQIGNRSKRTHIGLIWTESQADGQLSEAQKKLLHSFAKKKKPLHLHPLKKNSFISPLGPNRDRIKNRTKPDTEPLTGPNSLDLVQSKCRPNNEHS